MRSRSSTRFSSSWNTRRRMLTQGFRADAQADQRPGRGVSRASSSADEPRHLDAVIALAGRAYRRPLPRAETSELRGLYRTLRGEGIPHDEAIRLVMARVLVSPAFLYRLEKPAPGEKAAPVDDWELASRLSYFLWSSMPDDELRALAAAGKLRPTEVLAAQARRMCKDRRIRRLATEFACQWLHIYDFDSLDEKSERHFPTFAQASGGDA